jgi:hypothetical protein
MVTLVSPAATRFPEELTMKHWMKPAFAMLALTVMSQATHAQMANDKMAKPMGKEKTYTGCVEAGSSAGTFMLTHTMADMDMGKDAMKKDAMKKDAMAKDSMGHDAMAPMDMTITSTKIDLSKHVGHKVSVKGTSDGMGMGMAKPEDGDKKMSGLSVMSIKMISATCGM